MNNKYLCIGGTFDPIHFGHILCAREAAEKLGFDKIIIIPSAMKSHKKGKTDFKHRFEMCKLAIQNDPLFEVSDIEIETLKERGDSYTFFICEKIAKQIGADKVFWTVGADTVYHMTKWYNQSGLKDLVNFVIVERPGCVVDYHKLTQSGYSFTRVSTAQINISSTEIRSRLTQNKSIKYFTPERVEEYIIKNSLYVQS